MVRLYSQLTMLRHGLKEERKSYLYVLRHLQLSLIHIYAAGSYQVTSSDSIETQIVAGETADVDFTNDYNDKLIYSTGVVNHFCLLYTSLK